MKERRQVNSKQSSARCRGFTKAGKPCRAAATEGGLCFFHANPKKAAQLGRIGGRKNAHVAPTNPDPLPPLDTAVAVRNANASLIENLHAGKVDPKVASVMGALLNNQLRAIEATDHEQRIKALEKLAAAAERDEDQDGETAPVN